MAKASRLRCQFSIRISYVIQVMLAPFPRKREAWYLPEILVSVAKTGLNLQLEISVSFVIWIWHP